MGALRRVRLPTSEATEALGDSLARALARECFAPALQIALRGELGAGKTTLVRGFLGGLGYRGVVKSPSFTLLEPYRIGERYVFHFDFYRLVDAAELDFLGVGDCLARANACCLLEWPERAGGRLPEPDLDLELWHLDQPGREAVLRPGSERGRRLLERMGS